MNRGDVVELAIWLTGEETEQQVEHWKTVACAVAKKNTEREYEVLLSPWTFTEKQPGEDRVPPVPDDVHGINVRLLVAEATVERRVAPLVVKQSGFVEDLTPEDRAKLRKLTRKAHARKNPGDRLSDRHCDAIIEALGPDVAVKTLRDGKMVH